VKTPRVIASLLLCSASALALTATTSAQTLGQRSDQRTQLDVKLLDGNMNPLQDAYVTLTGRRTQNESMFVQSPGLFTFRTENTKAALTVDFPSRELEPLFMDLVLENVSKAHVTAIIDPETRQMKIVESKFTPAVEQHGNFNSQRSNRQTFQAGGPVANDTCASATPIGDGVTAFSTLGAGTDGPGDFSCQFDGQTYADIWYTYTATCTGDLTVSTCDTVDYDSDIVIYDGTDCGALSLLGCNDDGVGCLGYSSELEVPVVSGNDYLIRIGGYACEGAGAGPVNNDCTGAIAIGCDSTTIADNTDASPGAGDPDFSCIFNGPGPGDGSLWYSFVATDTSAYVDTFGSVAPADDSVIAIYDGSCGSLAEIACNDDTDGPGLLSEVCVEGLTPGNTYYIQLASFGTTNRGAYNLNVTCPCPAGPEPPANDDCADAEDVGALPATVNWDSTNATDDIVAGEECGVATGPWKNVWYTVTGTGNELTATTCTAGTVPTDTKISVFCGSCDDLVCVTGSDDDCTDFAGFLSTATWCSQPGVTYYVTAGMFSGTTATGPIEMDVTEGGSCVVEVACIAQGACCLTDGSCAILTEADCLAAGGDYQGEDTDCGANVVPDGGFEGGTPNAFWTEFSTNFGTPICDTFACGTGGGTGPNSGAFWSWFGGIAAFEEASVEQSIVIPTGATMLDFAYEHPVASGNGADFLNVEIDGNVELNIIEGGASIGYSLVQVDVSAYADGGLHTLRFDSVCTGTGTSNFFVDDVFLQGASPCETCVVLDFETDDGGAPLSNGQDISSPPEFGNVVNISASGVNAGAAIFDTDPAGPNLALNHDLDLLVDQGNALILQSAGHPGQTVAGTFDDPNDSSAGGTLVFDFLQPVRAVSVDLIDVDLFPAPQDVYVTLIDSNFNTRTYTVPTGWTEDIVADGGSGVGTLDLTTLGAQAGYAAVATVVEDAGFEPTDVVRMEVNCVSSAAVDNLEFCY